MRKQHLQILIFKIRRYLYDEFLRSRPVLQREEFRQLDKMNGRLGISLGYITLSGFIFIFIPVLGVVSVDINYNAVTGSTFMVFGDSQDDTDSWFDARFKCRILSEYADLAQLIDPSDVTTVNNLFSTSGASSPSYWFGIYDHTTETNFHSLQTGEPLNFTHWDTDRPRSDLNKNCGVIQFSTRAWRDEKCVDKIRGILCSMPTSIPAIDPKTGCPPTMVPFEGLCYDFRLILIGNFSTARYECEALPGRLIVPNSSAVDEFVSLYGHLAGKSDFWLGITDELTDDVPNNVYGTALSYTNWHPAGPGLQPAETDCAYLDTNTGLWLTDYCSETKGIMCEFVPYYPDETTSMSGTSLVPVLESTQHSESSSPVTTPSLPSTDPSTTPATPPTSAEVTGPLNCFENPLGMESWAISDAMISSSSSDSSYPRINARLNHGSAGWKPSAFDSEPWIEVTFPDVAWLSLLSTQAPGSLAPPPEGSLFEFALLFKSEGEAWIRHLLVFSANYTAGGDIMEFQFEQSLRAKQMRLYPVTGALIGLRMEVYGCYEQPNTECIVDADCNVSSVCEHNHCACAVTMSSLLYDRTHACKECWSPLGLESGKITDSQISASTSRSSGPHTKARLGSDGAWSPEDNDQAPWLMVTFNKTTRVTGMSTKGEVIYIFGFPNKDYSKEATIEYGILSTGTNAEITKDGKTKVFRLNSDEKEIVTNIFPYPVDTDFIKIVVVSPSAKDMALRLELLGCVLKENVSSNCSVDSDCHQGPVYDCVQQTCIPVRHSTMETTFGEQTTELPSTTEQITTINPITTETQTTEAMTTTTKQTHITAPPTSNEPTTETLSSTEATTVPVTTEASTTEASTTSGPATVPTTTTPSTAALTTLESSTKAPVTTIADHTTVKPRTTAQPTTTITTGKPSTTAPVTTIADHTTVKPRTTAQPSTTTTTTTTTGKPSTTFTAQPTTLISSTTRSTTLLMTSFAEVTTLYGSEAPVCLPDDVSVAGSLAVTQGVGGVTGSGKSEELLDVLRREAGAEGLGEQEIANLCSALSGTGEEISQGVTDIGLKVLLQITANRSEPIPPPDLAASVRFLESVAKTDWNSADVHIAQDTLEKMVNVGSNLLNKGNERSWKDAEMRKEVAGPFQIINSLEEMTLKVGSNLDKESSVEVISENIGINLYDISPDDLLLSGWNWTSSDAKFKAAITAQEFQKKNFSAYERALLVGGVFRNIGVLSASDVVNDDTAKSPGNGQLHSEIVIVMASTEETISMSVSYSTPKDIGEVVIKANEQPQFTCVYWEHDKSGSTPGSGQWSELGCYIVEANEESEDDVTCFCNHTTNFAVLMQVVDKPVSTKSDIHETILLVLTYACSTISIISLIIALVVFIYLGSAMASERLTIHKNLMTALLLAMVLFLLGVASNLELIPCKIVAIVLHYLFLAVFCWILVEGVHLYRQVIAVFEQGGSKMSLYYLTGWGVPAVVVGISLAIKYNLYGTGAHCWLTAQDGLIWAFVGPVILIVTVNMIVLIMVVVVVTRAAALKCQTNLDRIRAACKSALMLVPLLGISWVIGLFTQYTIVLEYAFVILNGLQGFFMFVFYCLLSSEVRTALRHELKKRADRNMDSSSNTGKTNVWTVGGSKNTHIRLVKVAPSTQNSDSA